MIRYASSTDHDIPALILNECKNNISYPVFLIWKESFESEVIPEDMKIQSITPIFKKGDKSDLGNYRTISLTSHLIKIFERVIRKKLVCHLESNSILSNKQHGFSKGRSCLTHLLKHIDDIIQSLLNGNDHDVIYLDFAKAFDKVDHELLIHKLRLCGVQGIRKVIKMEKAVSHQQETIRHHEWFPFNASSRLEWRSSGVSFRTYSFPSIYK